MNNFEQYNLTYTPLSLAVTSGLLEQGGQTDFASLQEHLEARGVKRSWTENCVRRTLLDTGLVELDDSVLTVSESGLTYVVSHVDRLDEADETVASYSKSNFAPAQYKVMNFLRSEGRDEDGWLYPPEQTRPVMLVLKERFDDSRAAMQRTLSALRKAGYTDQRYSECFGRGHGPKIINLQLTESGAAALWDMGDMFPEKIAKFEAAAAAGVKESALPPHWDEALTAMAMSKELNHMLAELGQPPRDFGDILSRDASDTRMLVGHLSAFMTDLERLLDAPVSPRHESVRSLYLDTPAVEAVTAVA